jgi:protoheme IX farnesyltransferase
MRSRALDSSTLAIPALRLRVGDYVELTKPRVAILVLFTVAAGALLAARGAPDLIVLVHALLGTALVAAGASALNQFLERRSDTLMQRTENRPLPAARMRPRDAAVFGAALGVLGVAYLAFTLSQPLAAFVAAFAFCSYVFVYTPLKSKTSLNTLVGAVPGALPPVIGWTAVKGSVDPEVMVLFLIVFLWQVPHFLAIAWMYRADYARAGLQMLPVHDQSGARTSRHMLSYCLALIPVSLAPVIMGLAGPGYLLGAIVIGLGFCGTAIVFSRSATEAQARRVLRASLIYLPALLALLVLDGKFGPVALAHWR